MSDEQQIRTLLTRAAELPDTVQPQVGPLLARSRRRRRARAALAGIAAGAMVAAAFAVPLALRGAGTGRPSTPAGLAIRMDPILPPATGPSASQLATYHWSGLTPSPLGALAQPTLIWTGQELLELGGMTLGSTTSEGAAFDPASGHWHRIAAVPGSVGTVNAVTVWTGTDLFVANGKTSLCRGQACRPSAGLYDPATNRWSAVPLPRQLTGQIYLTAVWTGQDVIVAASNPAGRIAVASLDPAKGRWHLITPAIPAGHTPEFAVLAATRNGLYLWSMWDHVTKHEGRHGGYSYAIRSGVDVYLSAAGRTWQRIRPGWPQHQTVEVPMYTGSELLFGASQIWCGARCSPPFAARPGFFADPATLHRSKIPGGPLGQVQPAFLWTGRALIAVSQGERSGGHFRRIGPDDMAAWDPAASQWYRLQTLPGQPDLAALPIWAGRTLLALTAQGALFSLHS